jgi:hypothetical protein
MNEVARVDDDEPHFLTLEALYSYHSRVLSPGASLRRIGKKAC